MCVRVRVCVCVCVCARVMCVCVRARVCVCVCVKSNKSEMHGQVNIPEPTSTFHMERGAGISLRWMESTSTHPLRPTQHHLLSLCVHIGAVSAADQREVLVPGVLRPACLARSAGRFILSTIGGSLR